MRTSSPNLLSRNNFSGGSRALPDIADPDENKPPAPLQMVARLGIVLAIALGFGLAAQVLVGVPH